MTAIVVRSNANNLPLPDNSVDLIVTSPPYFALRSYQDGGEHYAGQVGAESTPAEFVDSLIACTREWMRVLKPSGSLWVNLGDKYAADGASGLQGKTGGRASRSQAQTYGSTSISQGRKQHGVRAKSLIGIPWRYALRCIDDLGLILRAEVIWSKPNGLPESVTDRVRRSHEQWFHMTLEPRYYSSVDEIREAHSTDPRVLARLVSIHSDTDGHSTADRVGEGRHKMGQEHPLGKLPGSVWTIATQPLQVPASLGVDHFAAFPMDWPRRIIQGWSPSGVCVRCGEGRRPVSEAQRPALDLAWREKQGQQRDGTNGLGASSLGTPAETRCRVITGEACGCAMPNSATLPSVVLDPFGGTGTTALVASMLGRTGISVDLSHDYSRLAKWRTTDPAQRAKALQVDKPPVEVDGQDDLFGGAA